MLVLAMDTATAHIGVAIGDDGAVRGEVGVNGGRKHAERLAPAIEALCSWTGVGLRELDAIAVGVGPGLFTGLRVGVTTAKVMAQALGIPVVAIPSLDLVAYPLRHVRSPIAVVVDARRREVFHAVYRPVPGGVQRIGEYEVGPPAAFAAALEALGEDVLVAGDGVDLCREELAALGGIELAGPELSVPSVTALVALATARFARGEHEQPWDVDPLYLRVSDAELSWPTGTGGSADRDRRSGSGATATRGDG